MNSKQNEHKSAEDMLSALLGPTPSGSTGARSSFGKQNAPMPKVDEEDDGPIDEVADLEIDTAGDAEPAASAEPSGSTENSESPAPLRRRARSTSPTPVKSASGGIGRMVGVVLMGLGVAATALRETAPVQSTLQMLGIDGAVLLALGAVAFVLATIRRQQVLVQARIEELAQGQQQTQTELQENLQFLVEQHHLAAERPPAEGEELERVLTALDRQDEKVGNISRALKMYGKPLMEISTQGNDVAAQMSQLKTQFDNFGEMVQQGFTRLESTPRSTPVDFGPIEHKVSEMVADLRRTLTSFGERLPSETGLQQQLVRVEATITALSQRLDDSELRKSLLRLEDTHKQHGKKLEQLAHQDVVEKEVQRIEKQVDLTIGKLTNTVDQVRDKELGGLENTVREIQREVAGLATSVAYIQQAVRGGMTAGKPTVSTAHATSMATVGATAEPTIAASAQRAAETSTSPAAPATPSTGGFTPSAPQPSPNATPDAQAGVAENRTGARATSSKNVLGAIQKLKKLKG